MFRFLVFTKLTDFRVTKTKMESRSEKAAHTGTIEVKHDIYTGDRTDQTRNSDTRVRVGITNTTEQLN